MGCGAMSLNRRSGYADSYEPHRAAIRLLKGPHSSPFVQRSTEGARGSPATDQTRPGLTGADDGIRTRVNGFAGRCLATQPHPHCPARCHPGGINQSVSLTVISSPPGKVGTMQMWLAAGPGFFHGTGQSSRQLIELLVAFLLTALIGLEREIQARAR